MSFSSGARGLVTDAVGWTVVAAVGALTLANYDEIRAFASAAFGLPPPAAGIVATATEVAEPRRSGTVELASGRNGHFFSTVEVNGREVEVLVDTGASMVALTYEDAERAGVFLKSSDFTHGVSTANGMARVAPVTLDRISIGEITVRNVKAAVSERGRLQTSLLGMSFLGRLSRVDIKPGRLMLEE